MRTIAILISCLLITSASPANIAPEAVVQNFYSQLLKLKVSGLPNESQLKDLSPYLSARLLDQIENAQKYQEKFKKENPEEKLPLIEGALFSSLFEGISEFQIGKIESLENGYKVFVHFSYKDSALSPEITEWQDAVIIKQEGERLVIEDVEYLGDWPFKPGNRLSEVLKNAR
jgi:hypothetical protein